jgi:hypothetical protein
LKSKVKNAADENQVRRAGELQENARDLELNDLRYILNTDQGRRVIWRFMEHCRVFTSIMEASAKIYYNAGAQDVGHYLMAEVAAADDEALFKMMREAKQREVNNV